MTSAHGLKTPLQALLGEAARLRALTGRGGSGGSAAGIEAIVQSMRAHVVRESARARLAVEGTGGSCNAIEVAESVAAVLHRTPEGARLRIAVEEDRGFTTPGSVARLDRADLAEAIGALAGNAIRHACTRVLIACGPEQGRVVVRLRNLTPGFEAALDLPEVR